MPAEYLALVPWDVMMELVEPRPNAGWLVEELRTRGATKGITPAEFLWLLHGGLLTIKCTPETLAVLSEWPMPKDWPAAGG